MNGNGGWQRRLAGFPLSFPIASTLPASAASESRTRKQDSHAKNGLPAVSDMGNA